MADINSDSMRHFRLLNYLKKVSSMSLQRVLLKCIALSCALFIAGCGTTITSEPDTISTIMNKPRYANAKSKWSLVVTDTKTGRVINEINPDTLSFTGSVRKLFSVGMALNKLGQNSTFETAVYKSGSVDTNGTLTGNLILKAASDLTFGGRMKSNGSLDFTEFDHNDARAFEGAILTPQDPLMAINSIASQISAAGIQRVNGDIIIDDRLFESFRVLNGDVLISPMQINENLIDVTLLPNTVAGQPGIVDWRPKTSAYTIQGTPNTTAQGSDFSIVLSGNSSLNGAHLNCIGMTNCAGVISSADNLAMPALIPLGFTAPFVGNPIFISTLQIDNPASFARTALIDALARVGVTVTAPAVAMNATSQLPPVNSYAPSAQVAHFTSAPFSEVAKLILKVSLNTGANLSLMQFGITQGVRTREEALKAERNVLINEFGLDPASFNFPTNGSGTPDSQATARSITTLLTKMSHLPVYPAYHAALPIMGTDGSLTSVGKSIVGKENISVKTGTTVAKGQLIAHNNAGYIMAKSGRLLAVALIVNNAGPLTSLNDVMEVGEDEAEILGILYENN